MNCVADEDAPDTFDSSLTQEEADEQCFNKCKYAVKNFDLSCEDNCKREDGYEWDDRHGAYVLSYDSSELVGDPAHDHPMKFRNCEPGFVRQKFDDRMVCWKREGC